MTDKELIKTLMKENKITQLMVAEKTGKLPQQISGYLARGKNSMRVDILVQMLDAMGYELCVKPKVGNKIEHIIDMKTEE